MTDTIVALSSGRPPAAIGVIRVSGPAAMAAVEQLAGALPPARRAALRVLRALDGTILDRALVLVFPGPASATGEDLVELHCHGGRAVVAAVEAALVEGGVRGALPGEFTRRALANGRIDLAEAEGLADLLAAETEAQRRAAIASAEGQVGRAVRGWLATLTSLAARVEAAIDYDDEVETRGAGEVREEVAALARELGVVLAVPPIERLRDGVRVVIAGPPNSGKSTLINALAAREVAIVSPIAGTTRDRIDAAVQRDGLPFLLSDTAGLTDTSDIIEAIGVERARQAMTTAEVLLWLGDDAPPDDGAVWVHPRSDMPGRETAPAGTLAVSAQTETGVSALWDEVARRARALLPGENRLAINARQRGLVGEAYRALEGENAEDPLLVAEQLRVAHRSLAAIVGVNATEAMLDALFSRFCLGK